MFSASTSTPSVAQTHVYASLRSHNAALHPSTGLSFPIVPPCKARRVLPSFEAPGWHMYDAYHNCFLFRPELQRVLLAAAELAAERRRRGATRDGAGWHDALDGSQHGPHNNGVDGNVTTVPRVPCHCALDATQLFASPKDIPSPPLPLSRCELHEVHRALPPRWQCYPWRLCFDTTIDGFSLASLYRRMEAVETQQSQVKAVAFGLFFVHPREDTTTATDGAGDGGEATTALPPLPSASCSFSAAHASSSTRYGASTRDAVRRPPPPPPPPPPVALDGVIGCFTPEVPCLSRHPANVYYGSTDTYVFRLDQLSTEATQGAWMAADLARSRNASQRRQGASQAHQQQQEEERSSWTISNGSMDGTRRGGEDFLHRTSPHTLPEATGAPTETPTTSVFGYAALSAGGSDDVAGVPVPMPSRMMLQRAATEAQRRTVDREHMRPPPLFLPEEVHARMLDTPGDSSHADPSRAVLQTAAAQPPTGRRPLPPRHADAAAAPLPTYAATATAPASPAPRVVPQRQLLEKYAWCGRGDNKKFTVCNPHFLAIGGGKNGAAVYVDETLQHGTTSRWCDTFDAPCLFGPSREQADDSSAATHGVCADSAAAGVGDAGEHRERSAADVAMTQPSTATTPSDLLPHREFSVSRIVWFNIVEDKRTIRTMGMPVSVTADAEEGDSAAVRSEEAHVCTCGRCGYAPDAAWDPATAFAHHCDLLALPTPL